MPTRTHTYQRFWDIDKYRIIECDTCGYKHLDPIPDNEYIKNFYKETYYKEIKPMDFNGLDAEFVRKRSEDVRKHGGLNEIYNIVEGMTKFSQKTMVDVGCGSNLLGLYFQQRDWDVYAVEPSQDACRFLNGFGLKAFPIPVEEISLLNLKDITFVNMNYVLEHIVDPTDVLQKIYNILVPGGIIRIVVPNDFSEGQLAYSEINNEELHWVCLPDHINYFTFDSLSKLLTKTGFKEVYRTTNFPLEFLLMSGINYYQNAEDKARVHPLISNFESSFSKTGRIDLLKKLYENLAQMGFGRAVMIYAVKE